MEKLQFDRNILKRFVEFNDLNLQRVTREDLENEIFHQLNHAISLAVLRKGNRVTLNGNYEDGGFPAGEVDEDDVQLVQELTRRGFKVLEGEYPNLILPRGTQITVLSDHYVQPGSADFGAWRVEVEGLRDLIPEILLELWGEEENLTIQGMCELLNLNYNEVMDQLLEAIKSL